MGSSDPKRGSLPAGSGREQVPGHPGEFRVSCRDRGEKSDRARVPNPIRSTGEKEEVTCGRLFVRANSIAAWDRSEVWYRCRWQNRTSFTHKSKSDRTARAGLLLMKKEDFFVGGANRRRGRPILGYSDGGFAGGKGSEELGRLVERDGLRLRDRAECAQSLLPRVEVVRVAVQCESHLRHEPRCPRSIGRVNDDGLGRRVRGRVILAVLLPRLGAGVFVGLQ